MFDIVNFFKNLIYNMLAIFSFGRKKLSNTLSIYVKTNTGNTLSVDLEPHMDIKDVKEIVAPQLGLAPGELKIIFAGKELSDTITISECDLGQQSIIHAVKARTIPKKINNGKTLLESPISEETPEESTSTKPLCETLTDLQMTEVNEKPGSPARERRKAHFFVYCSQCEKVCTGKLRVRCGICKSGAFTVHRDPACWDDVLKKKRITGHCENYEIPCVENELGDPPFTEFYFKCSEHSSGGEKDFAAPLNLIKTNHKDIPCIACTDTSDTVLVFPCEAGHVTCLDCFRQYCVSRLLERQFLEHPSGGYTLQCPVGCESSYIEDVHHFKLLSKEQYERYQRFATEEFVLRNGGVLCPQPGCGMGLLVDPECKRIQCQNGCGDPSIMSIINIYHHNENIYNVEKKPPERPPKPPLYHSRFEHQVRRETKSSKDAHRTMGFAKIPLQKPDEFLKKNCGIRFRATKSAPVRLCVTHKPPVPKKEELAASQQQVMKCVDFKVENIKKVVCSNPKKVRPRYADTRKGDFHDLEKSGLVPVYMCQPKYGKVPEYLHRRKKDLEAQKQRLMDKMAEQKSACAAISQEERLELLKGLKKNWENLQREYQSLPLLIDTVPKMIRKAKLEKGLKELEKDILMMENNPYIYVYSDDEEEQQQPKQK